MLQSAGVAPFNGMQGRPFVDDGGEPFTARDCALIEDEVQTLLPGYSVRGRVRTLLANGWRMSVYDGVERGEMFNLDEDPDETENRWNDPSSQRMQRSMLERLVREMIAHSETSPLPEYAA